MVRFLGGFNGFQGYSMHFQVRFRKLRRFQYRQFQRFQECFRVFKGVSGVFRSVSCDPSGFRSIQLIARAFLRFPWNFRGFQIEKEVFLKALGKILLERLSTLQSLSKTHSKAP